MPSERTTSSWAGVSMPSATTSAPQRSARSRSVRTTSSDGVVDGAALDQRQVDLDDVEAELAEQPQAGVPGADVVGREADARHAAGLGRAAQPVDVLDGLALGQLEDDVPRIEAVANDHPQQRVDAEVVHLERARREVDRQRAGQPEPGRRLHHGVQAGDVELGRAAASPRPPRTSSPGR